MTTTPTEVQRRYDTLTKRIEALDTDISREIDSERRVGLQERRAALVAERDAAMSELGATAAPSATYGELSGLKRKIADLERALSSDNPQQAHEIIADCMTALYRIDERIETLEGRVSSIERQMHPPRLVIFWRVAAVVVMLFGVLFGVGYQTVLFGLYPIVGVVIEGSLLLLAVFCLLLANAKLRETPQ